MRPRAIPPTSNCVSAASEDRILVETVLSMLTLVCHFKKVMHRVWGYFHARLTFTMVTFDVLVLKVSRQATDPAAE